MLADWLEKLMPRRAHASQ